MNDDILWKIDSEVAKDKKVVELRRKAEELTAEKDYLKRKCNEMMTALKTYEKGRYHEHLENEILSKKLLKIKDLINRTPRQTPTEVAYVWLKAEIAKVIGDDKK